MLIGIDANEANSTKRVGVGQYAFHLIQELSKLDKENIYHLYLKSPPLADLPPAGKNWHYHVFGPSKLWTKFALPFHLFTDRLKLDLFYSPSHYSPHFSPFPTIPTIHDLGYLSQNDHFTKKDLYQLTRWTQHSLKQARHIVAVSEFTKNEITRIYGIKSSKISVVYNGVSKSNSLKTKSLATLKKFGIQKPYFLYLGTLKPSKNIPFLIEAFSHTSGHQLVIAGKKGWLFESIFNSVQKYHLEDKVIFTDYISENEKWLLYQNATATLLPSLYEGFGIPAIESQICGTPVIASNIPALKEILKDSALFIDPTNINSLVTALSKVQDPQTKKILISKGLIQSQKFTWQNSARSLIKCFSNI